MIIMIIIIIIVIIINITTTIWGFPITSVIYIYMFCFFWGGHQMNERGDTRHMKTRIAHATSVASRQECSKRWRSRRPRGNTSAMPNAPAAITVIKSRWAQKGRSQRKSSFGSFNGPTDYRPRKNGLLTLTAEACKGRGEMRVGRVVGQVWNRVVPEVVVGGVSCVHKMSQGYQLVLIGELLHHQEVTRAAEQVCGQLKEVGSELDQDGAEEVVLQRVGRAIKVAAEHTSIVLLEPSGRAPSIPHGAPYRGRNPRASFPVQDLKIGQEVPGGRPRVKPQTHPVRINKGVPSGVSFPSDVFPLVDVTRVLGRV